MQPVNYDFGASLLENPPGTVAPLPLAAGTYVTQDQKNVGRRGIKLVVDVTLGAGTVTVTIQGKDPVSGKYYTILTSLALGPGTTTVLTVYPGEVVAANVTANDVLPATWRLSVAIATAAMTATIGGSVIV
jgi:hypothetical protein